jgi:hypothetical protein
MPWLQIHLAKMLEWLQHVWDFHMWAVVATVGAVASAISILADWQRGKRRVVGQVSYMPWTAISMLAIGVTLLAVASLVKLG